jgi:hypothetical protein
VITNARYDGLIADLYGGLAEPARLCRFLHALADATHSHIGAYVQQAFHQDGTSVQHYVGVDRDEIQRYEAEYAAENVWVQRALPRIRAGAVLASDDSVSLPELKHTRYYGDYLRHIDTAHSVGLFGEVHPERCAMLTLTRCERAGAYDPDDLALLERVAPHFTNTCQLALQLEQLQRQAALGGQPQRALFLLDKGFAWIGGNEAAETMLATGLWRRHGHGPLQASHPRTQALWLSLQQQVSSEPSSLRPMPVHDHGGTLVAFATLHAYGIAAGESLPSYILLVRLIRCTDDRALGAHLMRIFDLTASPSAGLPLRCGAMATCIPPPACWASARKPHASACNWSSRRLTCTDNRTCCI